VDATLREVFVQPENLCFEVEKRKMRILRRRMTFTFCDGCVFFDEHKLSSGGRRMLNNFIFHTPPVWEETAVE